MIRSLGIPLLGQKPCTWAHPGQLCKHSFEKFSLLQLHSSQSLESSFLPLWPQPLSAPSAKPVLATRHGHCPGSCLLLLSPTCSGRVCLLSPQTRSSWKAGLPDSSFPIMLSSCSTLSKCSEDCTEESNPAQELTFSLLIGGAYDDATEEHLLSWGGLGGVCPLGPFPWASTQHRLQMGGIDLLLS